MGTYFSTAGQSRQLKKQFSLVYIFYSPSPLKLRNFWFFLLWSFPRCSYHP